MEIGAELSLYANDNLQLNDLRSEQQIIHALIDDSYYSSIYSSIKQTEGESGEYDFSAASNTGMIYLYLHRKEGKRKEDTKTEYARDIMQFIKYITIRGILDFREMKRSQMEEYQEWVESQFAKKNTQARKITVLSSFLKWCYAEKYLTKDLSRGLVGVILDRSQIPDREISIESMRGVLRYYDHDPKIKCLILLLASTGLRLNEVITPKWGDLYFDPIRNKYYLRTKTKRDGERHAQIKSTVLIALIEYRKRLGLNVEIDARDKSPLFPNRYGKQYSLTSLSALVSNKLENANFRTVTNHKTTAHFFRHYFARTAHNNGAPIDMIAKTLGHATSRTTENNYLSRELKKEHDVTDYVVIPGFED